MIGGLRIDRVRSDLERLAPAPADPDAFYVALVELLERHGLAFTGACWHLTDPATGVFTWTGFRGELPGDFASALENEYLEDDVGKYAELAERPGHVASLLTETGGDPRRNARYRRHMAPHGFADELRFAFADAFGRWGSMGVFADRPFSEQDLAGAAQIEIDEAAARAARRTPRQ